MDAVISMDAVIMTVQQQAYGYLRRKILNGELVGGTRLKADDIATELGISRMPVREALRQLYAEGLVQLRPNRGAIVTSLLPSEVLELFEIRSVLEGLGVRFAVPYLTGEPLEELRHALSRLNRARNDPEVWLKRHDEFHDFIFQYSNRPRLIHQIRQSRNMLIPYLRMYLTVYGEAEMGGSQHFDLVSAIATGDSDIAENAMREHVLTAAQGVVAFLTRSGVPSEGGGRAPSGIEASAI